MKRAIEEQRENAAENPITAAAGQKSNIENLLDIDLTARRPHRRPSPRRQVASRI